MKNFFSKTLAIMGVLYVAVVMPLCFIAFIWTGNSYFLKVGLTILIVSVTAYLVYKEEAA